MTAVRSVCVVMRRIPACPAPGPSASPIAVPAESLIELGHEPWARRDDLLAAQFRQPERFVRVRPVCRFRSRMRLLNRPMRLESNAHVTPDNRWAVFTSCSPEGRHEIWAARVPEAP